ncbi:MAG TPA: metal-dependent hydrolase [Gemmatimonadales bacterium]
MMDNLCHTLVGAALAETGLRRRTRFATAALVLGANLPDLDVPAAFTEHGLGFRRGITHGIPALIVLPILLTGLLLLWDRRRGGPRDAVPGQLILLSSLAIATHPLLDWMNVYGMRWLEPFDGTWVYGDSLFIVDPWLLLLLGVGWLAGVRSRRAGGEASRKGERIARVMVGGALLYVVAMLGLTEAGRWIAARDLGLDRPSRRTLLVAPPFLASWRREVIVDDGTEYRFGEIEWLPTPVFRLAAGRLPKRLELLDGLRGSAALDDLLGWARFPFARRIGGVIHVDDARYARGGRSFAGVDVPVAR